MKTGEVIRAALVADAPVTALVGTRIYPMLMPQQDALPAIVYSVVSDVPENALNGGAVDRLINARVQLDCYAKTYLQAQTLADAVDQVLSAMDSPDLSSWRLSKQDLYDNESQLHRVSADFAVWRPQDGPDVVPVRTPQAFWCYGIDADGNPTNLPNPDAVPTFVALGGGFTGYLSKTGAQRTAPAIQNLGDGSFTFTPSLADELVGTVALVDCGADCVPRYQYLAICADLNPFALYVPFDATGALSSGAPTVYSYRSLVDGESLPPPAVVEVGAFEIYIITPSADDLVDGVQFKLASSGGNLPAFLDGVFFVE